MTTTNMKQKLEEIVKELPENKLEAVLEFARSLQEKENAEEHFLLQQSSDAYKKWVSRENNIYDEVFKDAAPQR